jgi:tRNA(fMet)-specific endonuclease VapC
MRESVHAIAPTDELELTDLMGPVAVSRRRLQDAAAVKGFVSHVGMEAAATRYAQAGADLKKRGRTIGADDLLVAAHARRLGLLVTNSTAEFGRVRGLPLVGAVGGAKLRREGARAKGGGESGIRTHGRVSPTHAFQACTFSLSVISPCL